MSILDPENLVLNDINVESVTNESGTGVFDRLMDSVNNNILVQYNDNRITNSEYATVYLGSLQAVLSSSIQFVLQEQVSEAQISGMLKDNELKSKQLETANIEIAMKQYELDNLLPEQLSKLQEEIDLLQTQDSELLLDGGKKRLLMDEELETADLQQVNLSIEATLKTAQKDEIVDATIRAGTDLADKLLTTAKQRILLDEEVETSDLQQIILATEEELKTAQKDETVDATVRANSELSDKLVTSTKQRLLMDEEIQTADLQQIILATEEEIKTAQKVETEDSTLRANTQLDDSILTSTKQRLLMDEEIQTADLQQIILATEEELKTAQKIEVEDATLRANTQLDDGLLTSTEQREGLYTDRVLKDKQVAKLGLDNVMRKSEASRDSDADFIYVPTYIKQ